MQLEAGIPGSRVRVATFGSPPVLSLARGADSGDAILEALGMAPGAVRNYVLGGWRCVMQCGWPACG